MPSEANRPIDPNAPSSESLAALDDPPTSASHLSHAIALEPWIKLLVVTATLLLLTAVVAVGVRLLSSIGHTLLIFSLGGLVAYALEPIVERVRATRLSGARQSRSRSAMLVFLALFLIVGGAAALLSATMARQVEILARDHAMYENRTRENLHHVDRWLEDHNIKANVSGYLEKPPPNVKGLGETIAERALHVLGSVSRDVVEGLIVLLVALYFLIYGEEMRVSANRGLPDQLRDHAMTWQEDVNGILGGFVRGQLMLALTIGAMAAILCAIIGLRLWLLIGLFVCIAALVPVVGPFIGVVPAVVAALVSPHAHFHPAIRVAALIVCFGVINEVGSKILYPKLVGAALGLHEVLVLFILFAGFEIGGIVGVLFAAPLTALSLVTLAHLYRLWQGLPAICLAPVVQAGGKFARTRGTP